MVRTLFIIYGARFCTFGRSPSVFFFFLLLRLVMFLRSDEETRARACPGCKSHWRRCWWGIGGVRQRSAGGRTPFGRTRQQRWNHLTLSGNSGQPSSSSKGHISRSCGELTNAPITKLGMPRPSLGLEHCHTHHARRPRQKDQKGLQLRASRVEPRARRPSQFARSCKRASAAHGRKIYAASASHRSGSRPGWGCVLPFAAVRRC